MIRTLARNLGLALMVALFIGSAMPATALASDDFAPVAIDTTTLLRKVDGFVVVVDASQSMAQTCKGTKKLDLAKEVVARLNATLPEEGYQAGLRRFGQVRCPFALRSDSLYGVTGYSTDGMAQGLTQVTFAGGKSPLFMAIEAAGADLKGVKGKLALIVVSDGMDMGDADVGAAMTLAQTYYERICIYTIQIGADAAGAQLLKEVASAGGCGAAVKAADVMAPEAMAGFVKQVFFTERPDSDGDGVYDDLDKCPGTAPGVKVDAAGCEIKVVAPVLDSDGDGVLDADDRCPGTPAGAQVDVNGCWVLEGIYFETDKAKIEPYLAERLDLVADVLQRNPGLKISINGHTDNVGSAAYNQKLSERRAQAVFQYLVDKGVAADRMTAQGFGLTQPAASNDTAEGRALNRRVELVPQS